MAWSSQIRRRVQVDRPAGTRISATSRPITRGARPLQRATLPSAALRRRRWRVGSPGRRRRRQPCRHFQIAQDGSGRKWPDPASPTPAVPGCWAGGVVGRGEIRHAPADTCPRRASWPGRAVTNAARRRRTRAGPSGLRGRPRRSQQVPDCVGRTGGARHPHTGSHAPRLPSSPDGWARLEAGRRGPGRDGRRVLRFVAVVCVGTSLTTPGRAALPARRRSAGPSRQGRGGRGHHLKS